MSRLPTNTSAITALAALPPIEQNLKGLANSTAAGNPAGPIASLTDLETAIGAITTAAGTFGATTANLTTQRTYLSNLRDSLTTGVGSLVDANMNEADTKLAALQVQQQLSAQVLSISNLKTKLILELFER